MAHLTTARMAAFIPGQSPPLVSTPIFSTFHPFLITFEITDCSGVAWFAVTNRPYNFVIRPKNNYFHANSESPLPSFRSASGVETSPHRIFAVSRSSFFARLTQIRKRLLWRFFYLLHRFRWKMAISQKTRSIPPWKTGCRRHLQTPMEWGSGEPCDRNGCLKWGYSTATNSIFFHQNLRLC